MQIVEKEGLPPGLTDIKGLKALVIKEPLQGKPHKRKDIFEVLRDIMYRGKNRNKNRLIALKSKILAPARANKLDDLDKILTEWKHDQALVAKNTESSCWTTSPSAPFSCG